MSPLKGFAPPEPPTSALVGALKLTIEVPARICGLFLIKRLAKERIF
jgi:hypothetical protein